MKQKNKTTDNWGVYREGKLYRTFSGKMEAAFFAGAAQQIFPDIILELKQIEGDDET